MTLTFVILVVAAVVLGALIIKRGSPIQQKETTEEASDWTMFDWVNQSGEKIILQSRDKKPGDVSDGFETAVVIKWRYGMDGLPDQETMHSIYQFEDVIEEVRKDKTGIHVHTLTGNGIREWCYYTANFAEFNSRFNALVSSLPIMPIEISYQTDAGWDYWKKLKSNVQSHGA